MKSQLGNSSQLDLWLSVYMFVELLWQSTVILWNKIFFYLWSSVQINHTNSDPTRVSCSRNLSNHPIRSHNPQASRRTLCQSRWPFAMGEFKKVTKGRRSGLSDLLYWFSHIRLNIYMALPLCEKNATSLKDVEISITHLIPDIYTSSGLLYYLQPAPFTSYLPLESHAATVDSSNLRWSNLSL
jgi:hypothetical protein